MRITVLILGFALGAVMFAQTFAVYGLSNVLDDTDSGRAASAGIGMVALWLFAVAFVFAVPLLSILLFLVAGVVGLANAQHFPDLQVWGIASFALAGLAAVEVKQAKDKKSQDLAQGAIGAVRERMLCSNCGAAVSPNTRFCNSCGQSLASLACPTCGASASADNAFCGQCGQALPQIGNSTAAREPVQVSQPRGISRWHALLIFSVCVFLLAQAIAWMRSTGALSWANYLGIAVVVGLLGWVTYWSRKSVSAGSSMPQAVGSVPASNEQSHVEQAGAGTESVRLFPARVVTGTLLLAVLATAVVSGLDNRYFPLRISGAGMEPTLPNGALARAEGHAFDTRQPARGDVILYEDSGSMGRSVKRVVGLPGEHVTIDEGVVKIDGEPLAEPYITTVTRCEGDEVCDVVLDEDEFFVLGDNRANSADSRSFGPLGRSRVQAQVTSVIWPLAVRRDLKSYTSLAPKAPVAHSLAVQS